MHDDFVCILYVFCAHLLGGYVRTFLISYRIVMMSFFAYIFLKTIIKTLRSFTKTVLIPGCRCYFITSLSMTM